MIRFTTNKEGSLYLEEWCESPTVYLDHCAWRKISESRILATRFSNALKSRNGTLAFSWLNIIEFSKVTDERQTRKADALLDALMPRVFVINPDFFKVIGVENRLLAGAEPTAPHADLVVLNSFVDLEKTDSLQLFPQQNLFQIASATGIVNQYDGFADLVVEKVESLRKEYEQDKEFRRRAKRLPKGKCLQNATRFIASELLRILLIDKKARFDRNDAIDLCHTVVPVAYCEYVLLDSRWVAMVERAQARIRDGAGSFSMAKAVSEKANGFEKFLNELESDCAGVGS